MTTEISHLGKPLHEQFDQDFEYRLAAYYCKDYVFLTRAHDLVSPKQFSNASVAVLVKIVSEYYKMYKSVPSSPTLVDLIKAAISKKSIRSEMLPEIKESLKIILSTKTTDTEYMVDTVAKFARSVAFDDAILKAAELKDAGKFEEAIAVISQVQHIGVDETSNIYNYYEEILTRTVARNERELGITAPQGITTGYEALDTLLYHKGWGRKELTLFAGFAKVGKSTALGEFGIIASMHGYNVLYITLEVSDYILSERFDANISKTSVSDLISRRDAVKAEIESLRSSKKTGELFVVCRNAMTFKPQDLVRILESLKAKGMIIDMVIVDYADLMIPNYRTGDSREDSKIIYTDLRSIGNDYNLAMLTASQTNRVGGSSETAKMEHLADNVEKARIADLVITINKTEEEASKGEARLFLTGSRNQAGNVSIRIQQDLDKMKFIERILDIA